MKDNQAKYPQLRFKGCTDPWEQRKLGEVADIIGGGTPSTNVSEYWNGDIDWYSPVEIGNQIYIDESQKKITGLGLQKSSAHILPVGTVLFTSRAGIGNTAILAKEGCTNQGFQSIVPYKDLLNSYFIFSRTSELKRYGEINGAGSTFIEVSGKQMAKMPISVPSIEEQQKIGTFFQQLDHLITLHQRKLAMLKELKQGYLQKLFPKNGSKFPQLRFAGFADAWEQRKLSDIATLNARIGWQNLRTSEFLESGDYMLITGTNFHDGTIDYSTVHYVEKNRYEQDTKIQVENGSILITKDGTLGKVALVQGLNMPATLNAGVFNVKIKDPGTIDVDYVYQYLAAPFLMKYANAKSTGGTIKHLNQNILIDFPVLLPRKREQVKLAELLNGLDNTITLHQRKLEKLQELKKGYLQKMFC